VPVAEAKDAEGIVLPDWTLAAARAERAFKSEAPSRLFGEKKQSPSPIVQSGDVRFLRGRLIHRLLQSLPDLPAEQRRAAAERFLKQQSEIDAPQAEEILTAALAVLNDSTFAAVFAPGSRAEVPVAGTVPSIESALFVSGQIDRVAVAPDHVFIVDYKTDRQVPSAPNAVSRSYVGQLATYRALLAPLFPGKAIRCGLLWTSAPKLMEIEASALDNAITSLRNRAVS
jgi:ATP-dependent helicase/nuclease subunit A